MIKKFFGAILLLIIFSQNVSAERIDRVDEQFDFQSIHRVIVLDATVGDNLSYGGMVGLRGLQNTFRDVCTNTLNRDCVVYSEFAAMQILGENLKINLLRLSIDDSLKAREILMKNAWRIADAYIFGEVNSWGGDTYRANENAEYRDVQRGKDVVPVAENYLPSSTDVAAIGMTLRVYSAEDGAIIFERKEIRARRSDESQKNLFAAICTDFASDVAARIR